MSIILPDPTRTTVTAEATTTAPSLERYVRQHLADLESLPTYRPVIGCVIPAYNEAESIEAVLRSVLKQTRLPDEIHVVVNNTKDDTFELAAKFAGPRTAKKKRKGETSKQTTEVFVHDIGENPDKKVGALNYGFSLIGNADYLLGVDGDTTLAPDWWRSSRPRSVSDSRIGGISAIYTIDDTGFNGVVKPFLIAGQRAQFAAFNMAEHAAGPEHGRARRSVLDLSMKALREVMVANHQATPWVNDSEVEDSLLSLQIKSAGYLTKITAQARADVGGMTTHPVAGRSAGEVELRRHRPDVARSARRHQGSAVPPEPAAAVGGEPGHGDQHLHPDRVRAAAGGVAVDRGLRVLPVWLIPPVVAILLNLRIAMSIKDRTWKDSPSPRPGSVRRCTCG